MNAGGTVQHVQHLVNVVGDVHDRRSLAEVWQRDSYALAGHIRPGMLVLDVGANVGSFSIWAAAQGAYVVAVEPLPDNVEQLRTNLDRCAGLLAGKVRVVAAAAGMTDGTCDVHRGTSTRRGPDWSTGAYTTPTTGGPCEVLGLDSMIAELANGGPVDVMKCDCEGGEYPLFAGASAETLRRIRRITLEFHVWRTADDPPDPRVGVREVPFHPGDPERLVDLLSYTHDVDVRGDLAVGGYMGATLR